MTLVLCVLLLCGQRPLSGQLAESESSGLERLRAHASHVGIRVVSSGPVAAGSMHRDLDAREPTEEEAEACAGIALQEFSLYPRDLIGGVGLRLIVLSADMKKDGKGMAGVSYCGIGTLYLNSALSVEAPHTNGTDDGGTRMGSDREHLARTFHHEIFHFLDYNDSVRSPQSRFDDPDWPRTAELDRPHELPEGLCEWHPGSGFISPHAMSGVSEDKAEMFSALVIFPNRMREVRSSDSIIDKKASRILELIEGYDPESAASLWRTVEQARAPSPSLIPDRSLDDGLLDGVHHTDDRR